MLHIKCAEDILQILVKQFSKIIEKTLKKRKKHDFKKFPPEVGQPNLGPERSHYQQPTHIPDTA